MCTRYYVITTFIHWYIHGSIHSVQSFFAHTTQYIYTQHIHGALLFAFCPLLLPPCTPLCPLSLTWHPPVVIGIVHLPLRLLVNWPRLPHPSPSWPTHPKFPEPRLPAPTMTTSGIFWLLVSRTFTYDVLYVFPSFQNYTLKISL